ncbi:MAG: hypothetical protein IKQ25_09995 [Lachnospiraceae bacterium]|nr:hypothetical protein [Lachnospiraceae bacterium]MBR6151601.1 hypothetical protein [Lachnospiraceae bacterium]
MDNKKTIEYNCQRITKEFSDIKRREECAAWHAEKGESQGKRGKDYG